MALHSSRIKKPVRDRIARARFRRADHIVVEATAVRTALHEHWGIPLEHVSVISNTYDSVFDQPSRWASVDIPRTNDLPNLCYVARGYIHKNHAILGPLGDELERRGSPVRFILTLTPGEWDTLSPAARRHSVNLGPVTLEQLPNLYRGCDASVFPSLLECFSATPVESLICRTPLVASDRPFVHTVCGDAPWYADPQDPSSLADAVLQALHSPEAPHKVELGEKVARELPSARDRAVSYVELISRLLAA